jgi:hypothetical protein
VESWDEVTHVCKPNDSLESICDEQHYPRNYARALLLFNRDHQLAADGIRQEPPVLLPGQPVFIPPMPVLEKKYGHAIPGLTPLPPAAGLAPAAGVGGAPRPEPGNAAPGTSFAPPPAERPYKVRQGGEAFYAIAKRTLGDGARWAEIAGMNPAINPNAQTVPGGTVLHLPADARVEPENVP